MKRERESEREPNRDIEREREIERKRRTRRSSSGDILAAFCLEPPMFSPIECSVAQNTPMAVILAPRCCHPLMSGAKRTHEAKVRILPRSILNNLRA